MFQKKFRGWIIYLSAPSATNDFKDDDSKTVSVNFIRQNTFKCIFWCCVAPYIVKYERKTWLDTKWGFNNVKSYHKEAYNVPANLVITWLWSSGWNLANPKSAILGLKSWVRRILVDLISLWIILTWNSLCRWARPVAIPHIIAYRWFQSRVPLFAPPLSTYINGLIS